MKERSTLKLITVVFLCMVGLQLSAQKLSVNGKVVNGDDKMPLVGATVFCTEQGAGVFTDEEGKYSLPLNKEEKILLRFTYLGYDTVFSELNVEPGKIEYNLIIEMFEKGVIGNVVVITAGRHEQNLAEVPVSMLVIDSKTIDLQSTSEIQDVLQQTPGLDVMDDQINIRGSSGYAYGVGSRVMLMLDGLPLLTPDASFAQFDVIPTDNIQQIEVMKGAASVLYGSSAMGGVVNVLMADAPSKPRTSIRLRSSIYDKPWNDSLDYDGTSSPVIGAFNIFHSRKVGNNDFTGLIDLYRDTGYRAGTSQKKARAQILTKFRPIPGLTIGLNGTGVIDSSGAMLYWDSYSPGVPVPNPDSLPNIVLYPSKGALAGYGTLRRQLNQRFAFDPSVKFLTNGGRIFQYRGRMMKTINTNSTNQSNNNSLYYNDFQYVTPLYKNTFTWVTGGTYIYNQVRGDSLYGGKHKSWNAAIYSQIDGKIMDGKLNLSLGARYDYTNTEDSIIASSPILRAGMNYNLFPGNNIRASFGQAFRSPSVAERYTSTLGGGLLIAPNPTLKVERGYSAEIAARQEYAFGEKNRGGFGFLDVAAFMMDYNNMIEFGVNGTTSNNPLDPDFNAIFSAINITDTRITGVEATGMFGARWNHFSFDLNGGITIINPTNKHPTPDSQQVHISDTMRTIDILSEFGAYALKEKFDNPEFLKYRNKTTTRISATMGYKKYSLTCNFQAKSAIKHYDQILNLAIYHADYYTRTYGLDYKTFDFVIGYKINDSATFSFNLENAFNEQFVILPGLMGEQRKFTFQYKFVF